MNYLVIFNPNAANGTAVNKVDAVRSNLDNFSLDYELVFTEGPFHATEIAGKAMGKYDAVVTVGGDGTANEAINGLVQTGKKAENLPCFGMICCGRGNDFAYGVGIPKDLEEACSILNAGATRLIDIGRITGPEVTEARYFGNGIGIGFDTVVGLEASKIKWAQGFLGYLLGALKTMFFFYNAPTMELSSDQINETRPMLQISAMNGTRMGGAFYMAPKAQNNDGLLDLCIAGEPKRGEMLNIIVKYLKGAQEGDPHITFSKTKTLTVKSADAAIVMHADGETICAEGSEVTIDCLPGVLRVLCSAAEEGK
ncbi:MAG: diacylglycerol kinase family lipid kinase [Spirochaetales bacterium]|jgi:diacylglycerol kinase (ATP)|nr:diacylglycerol kinase family lipid kinase [Spirochaetales bacterium]